MFEDPVNMFVRDTSIMDVTSNFIYSFKATNRYITVTLFKVEVDRIG